MSSSSSKTGLKLAVVFGAVAVALLVMAVSVVLWLRRPQPPALRAVSPARIAVGGSLTLQGKGFAPEPAGNTVQVAGVAARVTDASRERLEVELPELGIAPGEERRVPIHLLVGDLSSAPLEITVYREAPPPEPEAAEVRPSAPPPTAAPRPAELRADRLQSVMGRARAALRQRRYTEATRLFDQALELDRANQEAAEGRSAARSELAALRRFVSGQTRLAGAGGDFPPAFEPSDEIKVQRAELPAAGIEFDVLPQSVRPGVAYNVKVYLRNLGNKDIKIKSVVVAASLNAQRSQSQVRPRLKKLPKGQLGLLTELPGVWKEEADTWSIAVTVETDKRDVFKNEVIWK